eukprot:13735962-Alexandrium_andersonii.AAC.1
MDAKTASYHGLLQQAINDPAGASTRSPLGSRFSRGISKEERASYKELRSDKQRADFRLQWVRREL